MVISCQEYATTPASPRVEVRPFSASPEDSHSVVSMKPREQVLLPLLAGYAMTVHRSLGMTISAEIDTELSWKLSGIVCVALSRSEQVDAKTPGEKGVTKPLVLIRNFDGLISSISADKDALRFVTEMSGLQ